MREQKTVVPQKMLIWNRNGNILWKREKLYELEHQNSDGKRHTKDG